ncbi:MAG: hypothetical protein AB2421_06370 [Thermotaleaceae bacterium]
MDFAITNNIVAIITQDSSKVASATAPVFITDTEQQQEKVAFLLSKVTMGMVHDLGNGCFVIVKH